MLVLNQESSPIVGSLSPTTKQAPILPVEASPLETLGLEPLEVGVRARVFFRFRGFYSRFRGGGVLLLHISVAFFR